MHRIPGGDAGGATPVPIPNTAVKPSRADGTALVTVWESRSLPGVPSRGGASLPSMRFEPIERFSAHRVEDVSWLGAVEVGRGAIDNSGAGHPLQSAPRLDRHERPRPRVVRGGADYGEKTLLMMMVPNGCVVLRRITSWLSTRTLTVNSPSPTLFVNVATTATLVFRMN